MNATSVIRQLNRDRVVEFEQEVKEKLSILDEIEKKLTETGFHRQEWLKSISSSFQTDSDMHSKMIEVLKAEADLSSMQLKLDLLRLESQYEEQKLSILVEMTKPLAEKETVEDREIMIAIKNRNNADILRVSLENSLDFRQRLTAHNQDLKLTLLKVKAQAEVELKTQAENVKQKLEVYKARMKVSAKRSQEVYLRILQEYLVLRHNAHVAEEILQRSQNDAALARSRLKECLEKILDEAAGQKARLVDSSEQEVQAHSSDLRGEIVRRERELEDVMDRVRRLQMRRKGQMQEVRAQVFEYESKYQALQNKRREDILVIHDELKELQSMMMKSQQKLMDLKASNVAREALAKLRAMMERLAVKDCHRTLHSA